MLSKTLSKKIKTAADEMSMKDLLDFLQNLESDGKIELNRDGWDYAIDFARHLVDTMKAYLDKDEWYGYELKALNELEKIPCDEYDVIRIDNYGFPCEIKDNEDLLYILGIDSQLAA